MAYSELIKNFQRVRDYMRAFYVFGFKSRDEYNKKSGRSYDNERRRIESWLGDYMRFSKTEEGTLALGASCGAVKARARIKYASCARYYAAHGYDLPEIVFWNVESRNRNLPVTMNENGAALVSGCTPRIFQMVEGDLSTPYELMLEILSAERYEKISA